MSNKLNISSSGTFAVGNIVQGNNNQVSANVSADSVQSLFDKTNSDLTALGLELERPSSEVDELRHQLKELKEEAIRPTPDQSKGGNVLKTIRENFSWAYPLVKEFVKAIWPSVLSVLG